jgi:caffeoyl-CoA O-methyltransferase
MLGAAGDYARGAPRWVVGCRISKKEESGVNDKVVWQTIEYLEELEEQGDLQEELWHISRDTGVFLNLLLRHSRATRVLEIGTSSGYSGLFFADAMRANGGKLITCEMSEFKIALAKESFERAGLSAFVEIVEGDAISTLDTIEGPFDLVFIDGIKHEYVLYLSSVWPKVREGGLVIADNMLSHQGWLGIEAYRGLLRMMDDASTVTVPIGSGTEITCKMEHPLLSQADEGTDVGSSV